MYTDENYLWGLVTYYLGVGLVLACCWHYRRWIPWLHLRNLILALIAVVLLLPFTAYPEMDYLAPAWFIAAFEGLTDATEQGYLRAGVPLIVGCFGAVIAYVVAVVSRFFWRRKKTALPHDPDDL